ncbi:MAG: hypothetical protein E7641_07770 [Ruminococcaceae bacterium]|nr:hypothetical protein [Oscillospiraceae bacterium]
MNSRISEIRFSKWGGLLFGRVPFGAAALKGGAFSPSVSGKLSVYSAPSGIILSAEVFELPYVPICGGGRQRYGLRIEKEGGATEWRELPDLLGNCGYAWAMTVIGPYAPEELIGASVSVISDMGQVLASGKIQRVSERNIDFGRKMLYNI